MGKNKDRVKTVLSSDFKVLWKFNVLKPRKIHFMRIGKKIDDAEI